MAVELTRTIATRVSEEDYARLTAVAGNRRFADWMRDVLLRAALVDPAAATQRVILAELLAMRKVLFNLQFAVAAGEPITPDLMHSLIDEADATKHDKALERLSEG